MILSQYSAGMLAGSMPGFFILAIFFAIRKDKGGAIASFLAAILLLVVNVYGNPAVAERGVVKATGTGSAVVLVKGYPLAVTSTSKALRKGDSVTIERQDDKSWKVVEFTQRVKSK